jgi:hypothetical protein
MRRGHPGVRGANRQHREGVHPAGAAGISNAVVPACRRASGPMPPQADAGMSTESLDPGEWGPFEELAAAAAEILRLRALLRLRGTPADAAVAVPRGHLVYDPEAADAVRGRAHRTVLIESAGQSAAIDELIAPLLAEIWKAGIRTLHSCQENPSGFVWIEFDSVLEARRFVHVALGRAQSGGAVASAMRRRALHEGPEAFWPLSRKLWLYKVSPQNHAAEGLEVGFTLSVRFPHQDLPLVLDAIQRHNRSTGGAD